MGVRMDGINLTVVVSVGIGLAAVLGFLYVLAALVRSETQILDFQARVAGLRVEKARRLREIAEATGGLPESASTGPGGPRGS